MGYCCTRAAADSMNKIANACRTSSGGRTNVFSVNGKVYHFEQARKDLPDGGEAGTIWLHLPNDLCKKVGSFRIDGRGLLVRGPSFFKKALGKV